MKEQGWGHRLHREYCPVLGFGSLRSLRAVTDLAHDISVNRILEGLVLVAKASQEWILKSGC